MGVAGPDGGKCKLVSAAHVTPGLSRETNTVQAEDDRKCVKVLETSAAVSLSQTGTENTVA